MIACATSVTAIAASGYSVRVRVSSPVAAGQPFTVEARGVANQHTLLYVYVDRHACRSDWEREARRVGVYKSGHSYFLQNHGGPPTQPFDYTYVSGSFTKSFIAHAGAAARREHACAYLMTANKFGGLRVTAAHGSASYTVTK